MIAKLIILFFSVGILMSLTIVMYQRIALIGFAKASTNYYEGSINAKESTVITLRNCEPGVVPFLPSLNAQIVIGPYHSILVQNGKTRIINADSVAHTIQLKEIKFSETIDPGSSLEISGKKMPIIPKLTIGCDNIDLGDQSPTIILNQL